MGSPALPVISPPARLLVAATLCTSSSLSVRGGSRLRKILDQREDVGNNLTLKWSSCFPLSPERKRELVEIRHLAVGMANAASTFLRQMPPDFRVGEVMDITAAGKIGTQAPSASAGTDKPAAPARGPWRSPRWRLGLVSSRR